MSDNGEKYRRMPTTGLGSLLRFFERSSAWLARDHILVVKRILWFEHYSRFYMPDIQAVSVCKTQVGLVWNILLGILTALMALGAVLNDQHPGFMIATAIFVVPLLLNIGLGPTCICCVYTAVNVHKLNCFNRMSKARRFLQAVTPMITEVQGQVSDEEIARKAPLIPPLQRSTPGAPAPHKIHHYEGHVHMILIVTIMFAAIIGMVQLGAQETAVGWIFALVLLTQFAMAIAAAGRQSGTDIPSGLRLVVWAAFAHSLLMPFAFLFASFTAVSRGFNENGQQLTEMLVNGILLASVFVSGVLCLIGRHLLVKFRHDYAAKLMAARTPAQTFTETEI
jgi:hypothetical protein